MPEKTQRPDARPPVRLNHRGIIMALLKAAKAWTFECGWLLDNYMKDREAIVKHPRAVFQFQPQIRTVKKET